jgi:hypothetical protein
MKITPQKIESEVWHPHKQPQTKKSGNLRKSIFTAIFLA